MLEPFGVSVLNTVLSARPLASKASSSHPAFKMLTRVNGSSFPHDFFTPRPRGTKGKERATVEESPEAEVGSGRAVACAGAASSSMPCTRMPSKPSTQSLRQRTRFARRPGQRLAPESCRIRSAPVEMRCCDLSQRRHASTAPHSDAPRVFVGSHECDQWLSLLSQQFQNPQNGDSMESAWTAYEGLRSHNKHELLTPAEVITICHRIVKIQISHGRKGEEQQRFWQLWGGRLLVLLQDVDNRIPRSKHDALRQNWYRLRASALALVERLDECFELLKVVGELPEDPETRAYSVFAYNIVMRCLHHYRGPEAAIEFIVDHWNTLDTFFVLRTEMLFPRATERTVRALRWGAFDIAAMIQNPVLFLRRLQERWSKEKTRLAGLLLIDALCQKDLPFDALALAEEMQQEDMSIPPAQRFTILKALITASAFELANNMFLAVSQDLGDYKYQQELFETGLYLFAQQGDAERVEEYAAKLHKRGTLNRGHISLILHTYAVRGDPAKAVEAYDRFFARRAKETRAPDIAHMTAVIHAYSQCGDHTGINAWLEKMIEAGYTPDAYVYNVILQCFARRGEVTSVGAILDQMRASKCPPTHITYSSVITMLAQRRDAVAAEAIYKRAIGEGVVVTSQMVNALMNAHVEAGSWEGVITAFDYLKSAARRRGVGVTVSTYNTLLKAYVLAGAPFQTVFGFFTKMKSMRVKPDEYTYALVIQSACDSELMDTARELFAEMEEQASSWVTRIQINVYVLTILMGGYLRLGLKARAKAVYDQMILRGIQPTSHTFRHIITAYSNPRSPRSIAIAEKFLTTLKATRGKTAAALGKGRNDLDYLYGPLLTAYTLRMSRKDVERLLQNLFDEGGVPTISNLSVLLDLYRRKHDIDGVKQIWPQIHQLALQESDMDSLFVADKSRARRQGNILCVPLSMYIDALSAAGHHTEVPVVWRRLANEGFTFDSHNWNHLVVALVRAGEVERAFEVVERVILPYRRLAQALSRSPETSPASPLTTDLPAGQEKLANLLPWEAPLGKGKRRAETVALFTKKAAQSVSIMNLSNFTHPLEMLHQVAPTWNAWRPHGVVLALLHKVMLHLADNRRVHPVQGKAPLVSPTATTVEELEQSAEDLQPRSILARIYENYPHTVNAVDSYHELFKRLKKRRAKYQLWRQRVRKVKRLRRRGIPATAVGGTISKASKASKVSKASP